MVKRNRGLRLREGRAVWWPPGAALGCVLFLAMILTLPFLPLAASLSAFSKLAIICFAGAAAYCVVLFYLVYRWSRDHTDVSLRLRMFWAIPPLLAPLMVPALAFLATEPIDGSSAWTVCALSELLSQKDCVPSLRWPIVALSLVPAFSLLMLIWWKLCSLMEVRWLFERPWSGLGEDTSQANAAEGLAQATITILAIVICLIPICFALLSGVSKTGAMFSFHRQVLAAPPRCADGDGCKPKQGVLEGVSIDRVRSSLKVRDPNVNLIGIRKALEGLAAKGEPSAKALSEVHQSLLDIDQTLQNLKDAPGLESARASLQKIAEAKPAGQSPVRLTEIEQSLRGINGTLDTKLAPSMDTLRDILSAKADLSVAATTELRKTLQAIDQTLQNPKEPPGLESVRTSLQKIADAMPAGQSPVRLTEVEQALKGINGTLAAKLSPAMDTLKDIRKTLEALSAKDDLSASATMELRKTLQAIDQTLQNPKEPPGLESVRTSLQKIADAMPAGQSPVRLTEVEQALKGINGTLATKLSPAMDTLKDIRKTLEALSAKDDLSASATMELRKTLQDIDQTLRNPKDASALESVRASLQRIADAMPAGQSAASLVEVERSLGKINDTLAAKLGPAVNVMGPPLGSDKPDCFDVKFMARPAPGSALMKAKGTGGGQKVRAVKSYYLPFDKGKTDIPADERQQISAFLSDGAPAGTGLSVRGLADGLANQSNEDYATKRAVALAEFVARTQSERRIVDLQWSVGGERSATIKVVEECR